MNRLLRLRRPQDFARVRQQGLSLHGRWLLINVLANGLQQNRYGFVTAKRLGSAVTRNRARRLLREAVRQIHPQIRPGYDMIIVARPFLVDQSLATIQAVIVAALKKANLLLTDDRGEMKGEDTHEST